MAKTAGRTRQPHATKPPACSAVDAHDWKFSRTLETTELDWRGPSLIHYYYCTKCDATIARAEMRA